MSNIAVFGMGYVGCVTAACLSRDGHKVIGVDVDEEKIAAISAGRAPVSELGLSDLMADVVDAGRLEATDDVADAVQRSEIAFVAVGTPSDHTGAVFSGSVERVVEAIGQALRGSRRHYLVVIRSTLLPGILEEQLSPLLEQSAECKLGRLLCLCNHPEFLREGSAIHDYDEPPFIVVGANGAREAEQVFDLYGKIDAERILTDTRTAALVKYTCNAFHALKVTFANEIGTLAQSFGANGHEVMQMVCRDRKLNISPAYMKPGFAFGGSCLPKDLRGLPRHAEQQALRLELLKSILPSNDSHLDRAIRMVQDAGQRSIGIIGLSFKAGTDDLRESPLVMLAETLMGRGYDLKIYDPGVAPSRLIGQNLAYADRHLPHLAAMLTDEPEEVFHHSSLLVLGTDVADDLDWKMKYSGDVIDLRYDLGAPWRLLTTVQ